MPPTIKKICSFCQKSIVLEHHTLDGRGLPVHSSCLEKQMLLQAATREADLWRRNLALGRTA